MDEKEIRTTQEVAISSKIQSMPMVQKCDIVKLLAIFNLYFLAKKDHHHMFIISSQKGSSSYVYIFYSHPRREHYSPQVLWQLLLLVYNQEV